MGCAVSRKKKPQVILSKAKTLVILPGTFVKINDNDFVEVYNIGKKLGSGAYAEVRFCTHRQNKANRAVKIIAKQLLESESAKNQFIKEIEILKLLDHPNIIRVFEFFEDENNFYIVMEHCKGGELFDEIIKHKNFNEYQAAHIIRQVFSCIAYLHSIRVVHRDIKPENLLLEEKDDLFNIKLIDFGIATIIEEDDVQGMIGTPSYIAPEVINERYNEKCDVWSAGVLMYILLCGFPPFQGSTKNEVYEMIKNCSYILDGYGWENISSDAKDLIKKILVPQSSRISAEKALKHKWIVSMLKKDKRDQATMKTVLKNLEEFNAQNKLQEAAKLFIITQLMSTKEIKEARDIFKELDENGDGKLSRQELIKGYRKFASQKDAEDMVDRIMAAVDTDHNGFIDYNEFLKAAVDVKKISSEEYLQTAFNLFDKDANGKISIDELKSVLQSAGEDEVLFQEIIKQVDINGDGEIDLEEFTTILKNVRVSDR
ncbi:hypothetical protein SteCoe_16865 [Stentor coeruleus]|uniref:non-specific serine/threonine protein kinase n=1 Tax=Stentor coeruleus TaxID=5963 RepID=A0A1R2C0B9_9CILI|nr:hypothetical protein SteCoe_16865 [Stentor coeruleus]